MCAVENVTATKAISRSLLLTRGQRWRLLGLLAIIVVLTVVLTIIVGLVSMMAGFSFAGLPGLPGIALRGAVFGVLGVFGAACNGSAYVELRTAREGVGAGDLAAVFA